MVDLADSVKILGSGNVVDGLDLSNFLTLQKVGKRVLGPCAEGSSAKVVTDWNGWAKQWNNTLVVNFLGKSPPLPVFQRTADKLWGREVDLGDDNVIDVGVELVWAPPKCSHCSIFGHLEEKCARSVVVDDSAQLNASNGIAKLEIVVSTNLVDFVEVCAQPVERVLDEVSIGVVGNCENVVDDVIAGVVGNCVNVVDDVIVGNLVSSTGVAIFEIVTSFADVVPAQVDDNLLVGDGSGSCSGKDIVVSMGDAVLSPNKFDALATAAVE
ncbi:hypothetical protein V6N12_070496 [Hibiscus sabdariffa]|uniref:Uncharacterized protein n=1 Tax=Hibiscus sabdariffa TaxID=183260 RepID=A0ABR2FGZ8_9ROSI